MSEKKEDLPVIIETGPSDWQVIQQDSSEKASVVLKGRWSTIIKQKKPDVMVRVTREGGFAAVSKTLDWKRAKLTFDRSVKGPEAGKCGKWSITLKNIPCGGPYRIETTVGNAGDALEWRRGGQSIHFVCVGDVWLIAGQSNAEGYGRDPVDDPSEIGIHQLGPRGWGIATHSLRHHPWIIFAKKLKRELGYPIGIIPTAVGGSAVSEWDPGQRGQLFANMKRRLAEAGNRIRGCLWYQGESDVGEKDYPKYKVRFGRFVKGVRSIVKQPKLPFITVQLNRVLGEREDGPGWDAMREIQRQLSHEIENVFVIPVFEAGLCDGIHISSTGNVLIAERAARTALGGIYGQPKHYLHPECSSAKSIGKKSVKLRFANVVERLDFESAIDNGFPFAVRDCRGDVPVSGYRIRKNVIIIELARAIEGNSAVTGAPGLCPPHVLPKDISGYRCMLAFTIKIESGRRK